MWEKIIRLANKYKNFRKAKGKKLQSNLIFSLLSHLNCCTLLTYLCIGNKRNFWNSWCLQVCTSACSWGFNKFEYGKYKSWNGIFEIHLHCNFKEVQPFYFYFFPFERKQNKRLLSVWHFLGKSSLENLTWHLYVGFLDVHG